MNKEGFIGKYYLSAEGARNIADTLENDFENVVVEVALHRTQFKDGYKLGFNWCTVHGAGPCKCLPLRPDVEDLDYIISTNSEAIRYVADEIDEKLGDGYHLFRCFVEVKTNKGILAILFPGPDTFPGECPYA